MALAEMMDVHVPAAVSEGLRRLGHDVLTAQADGADRLADDDLLARANALGRVLFTQDDDLLRIAARWQSDRKPFRGILFAHQLSLGIGPLVDELNLVLSACEEADVDGRVLYLPLR
ncbi:DUF5615 family PIN-like protein [Botrimarina sp.]|uniref:DUF5615 family PIN-like protein n=1 Tax=Botrimarina sp. TaxID=2795802 RepID=UPI0032EB24A8